MKNRARSFACRPSEVDRIDLAYSVVVNDNTQRKCVS